jgi:hypothetical protein
MRSISTRQTIPLHGQLAEAMERHLANPGKPPAVPPAGALAWAWFIELSGTRGYNAVGPNPITYAEIAAWAALMRWPLRPEDVQAIRVLDEVYIDKAYGKLAPGASAMPKEKMTPELFDALFG